MQKVVRYSNKFWPLLLIAIGALYFRLYQDLSTEWQVDPQYSYGWLVPILSGYLFFLRWEKRPKADPLPFNPFVYFFLIIVTIFLLPISLLDEANPEWREASWLHASCVTCLTMAFILRIGGFKWAYHFAFPILFLLLAVAWPLRIQMEITLPLMQYIASCTVEAARFMGIPTWQEGNTIRLENGVVGIDEACSGVRSLQGSLMTSLFLGEFYRLSWIRRLLLVISALILSLLANFARAMFLTWIADKHGVESVSVYHDSAGYSVLILVFICTLLIAKIFNKKPNKSEPIFDSLNPLPSLTPLLPIIMIVWLGITEIATELWYKHHEKQQPVLLDWSLNWKKAHPPLTQNDLNKEVNRWLRYDHAYAGYLSPEPSKLIRVIELNWNSNTVSVAGMRQHGPEHCLPAIGHKLIKRHPKFSTTINGIKCHFDIFEFLIKNQNAYVFQSTWERGYAIEPYEQRLKVPLKERIRNTLEGRRQQETSSVTVLTLGWNQLEEHQNQLVNLLQQVMILSSH